MVGKTHPKLKSRGNLQCSGGLRLRHADVVTDRGPDRTACHRYRCGILLNGAAPPDPMYKLLAALVGRCVDEPGPDDPGAPAIGGRHPVDTRTSVPRVGVAQQWPVEDTR